MVRTAKSAPYLGNVGESPNATTPPGATSEVHISNVHKREPMYHKSLVSAVATAVIAGLGPYGYVVAIQSIKHILASTPA